MKNFKEGLFTITLMIAMVFVTGCGKETTPATNNNSNPNNNLPMVETTTVTEITGSSVTCGGKVTSSGGSAIVERGFCWSKTPNPLVSDFRQKVEGESGDFSCVLTGLEPNTTYYVKAYAINGAGIGYGSAIRFATLGGQPGLFTPEIAVIVEEGYVQDGDVVTIGEEVFFGFFMSSNSETHKKLSYLVVTIDDEEWETVDLSDLNEYTYRSSCIFGVDKGDILGEVTFKAVVTDVTGAVNAATIRLLVEEGALEAFPFEWYRNGGNPGVGLEEFGLEWVMNAKDVYARIRPMDGVRMFEFDPDSWDFIITASDKVTAFAEGYAISEYANVSVYGSNSYNDLIGTILPDGTMRLIHITQCEVSYDMVINATIYGEWK